MWAVARETLEQTREDREGMAQAEARARTRAITIHPLPPGPCRDCVPDPASGSASGSASGPSCVQTTLPIKV